MSLTFACSCGFTLSAAKTHAGMYARCPECAALTAAPGEFAPPSSDSHRATVMPPPPRAAEVEAVAADATVDLDIGIDVAAPSSEAEPAKAEPLINVDSPSPSTDQAAVCLAPDAAALALETETMCAACADATSDADARLCIHCHAAHHLACWGTAAGCAVPTCVAGPKSRKQIVRTADQEEVLRACPICAEQIPVRAHRCRYCGEFTDPALRQDNKKRRGVRMPTSGYASFSLGFSIISFFFGLISDGVIQFFTLFLIGSTIILALRGFRDIKRSGGKKSGHIPASFALGITALNILIWLLKII